MRNRINGLRVVCTIVEKLGPSEPRHVSEHATISSRAVRTYLGRAYDRGLMTRQDGKYMVVSDWCDMVGDRKTPETAPARPMVEPLVKEEYTPRRHVLDSWLCQGVQA